MSRIVERKEKSVLPLYITGAAILLCGILFPLYRLWALVLTAAVGAGAYFVSSKMCPDKTVRVEVPFMTGSADADAMLADMGEKLQQLHALNEQIPNDKLSQCMNRMEKAGRSIVAEVEAHPDKAKQVRRFANYYLPDAVKILTMYAKMDASGVQGENATEVRTQVEANTEAIATAFENQLDSLFAADALDISTDIEVLQGMLKGQGLSE